MADDDNEWPAKGSADRLDYGLDFRDFIALNDGATITGFSVASVPAGLTIETPVNVDGICKMWISGGTVKTTYSVSVTLTATVPGDATGLTAKRTKTLYVQDM